MAVDLIHIGLSLVHIAHMLTKIKEHSLQNTPMFNLNPAWVRLLATQPELFTMLSFSKGFHPMQLVITVTQKRERDGHLLNKAYRSNN